MAMLLIVLVGVGHFCQRARFVCRGRDHASRGERGEAQRKRQRANYALKQQMALQQKQIEQMQKAWRSRNGFWNNSRSPLQPPSKRRNRPNRRSRRKRQRRPSKPPSRTPANLGEVASTSPMIPQSQKNVENAICPGGGVAHDHQLRPPPAVEMGKTRPFNPHWVGNHDAGRVYGFHQRISQQ